MDVLILVGPLEDHPQVVDHAGLTRLQLNYNTAAGVLLKGDLTPTLFGLQGQAGFPITVSKLLNLT